ncbi:MAG: hypothetical protein KJ053_14100 [Dehalococcoidia bacterium]|nr:hypothetical protein [Dehalococcoidia bacterium]
MAIRPGKNIKLSTPAKEAAKGATVARKDDDALRTPPRTDDAAKSKDTEGSSLDVFGPPAAGTAARTAATARGAVGQRVEKAIPGPDKEEHPVTTEASTEISDRLDEGLGDMLDRAGREVLGKDTGAGEQEDGTGASRDSGKGGLQRTVDEAFPTGDEGSESSGAGRAGIGASASDRSGLARMGTPEDLGVTGDVGAKGDLGRGSGAGLDVFNVDLSGLRGSTAASGDSDELGLLQGIVPETGDGSGGKPSVAIESVDSVDEFVEGIGKAAAAGAAIAGAAGATGAAGAAAVGAVGAGAYEATRAVDDSTGFGQGVVEGIARVVEDAKADEMRAALANRARVEAEKAREQAQRDLDDSIDRVIGLQHQVDENLKQGQTPVDADTTRASDGVEIKVDPGPGQPQDPGREGSGVFGRPTPEYMAWRAAARARLGLGESGSGDVDPSEGGAAEDVPGGPAPTPLEAGQFQKALRDFLIGQPSGVAAIGGGSIDLGRLPGDSGDIDPGEDDTGAWTSDTRTENESEALDSLGGSGLTIGDAHRKDEDDEEDEDDHDDES